MRPLTAARPTPYADADDAHTMRGDCRIASVRMGLPDPRDRHLLARASVGRDVVRHEADADAARLAARLGL